MQLASRFKCLLTLRILSQCTSSNCDVLFIFHQYVVLSKLYSLLDYMNRDVVPASVRVASLLEKRTHKSCGFKADYVGFSIPDKLVSDIETDKISYKCYHLALNLTDLLLGTALTTMKYTAIYII